MDFNVILFFKYYFWWSDETPPLDDDLTQTLVPKRKFSTRRSELGYRVRAG